MEIKPADCSRQQAARRERREKRERQKDGFSDLNGLNNCALTTDIANGPDEASTEDFGYDCCGGGGVSLDIGVVVRA